MVFKALSDMSALEKRAEAKLQIFFFFCRENLKALNNKHVERFTCKLIRINIQ